MQNFTEFTRIDRVQDQHVPIILQRVQDSEKPFRYPPFSLFCLHSSTNKQRQSISIPFIPLTPFIIDNSDEDDLDRLWLKEASEKLLLPNKEKSLAEDVSNFIAESNMIVDTKKTDKDNGNPDNDVTLPSIATDKENLKPSTSPELNCFTSKLMEETKKLTEQINKSTSSSIDPNIYAILKSMAILSSNSFAYQMHNKKMRKQLVKSNSTFTEKKSN